MEEAPLVDCRFDDAVCSDTDYIDSLCCWYCAVKHETSELRDKHEVECSYGPRLVIEIQVNTSIEKLLRSKTQQSVSDGKKKPKKLLKERCSDTDYIDSRCCRYCVAKHGTSELRKKHEVECSYGPRLVIEIQVNTSIEELLRSKTQQSVSDGKKKPKKLLKERDKHEVKCSYGPRLVIEIQVNTSVEDLLRSKIQQAISDENKKPKRLLKERSHDARDKATYKCDKCPFTTIYRCNIRRHTLVHEDRKSYVCFQCGHSTHDKRNLARHISSRHLGLIKFPCRHCTSVYKSKQVLQEHILRQHPKFTNTVTYKLHSCDFCDFKSTYKYYVTEHMLRHKKNVDLPTFKCTICIYETNYKSHFRAHLAIHDPEKRARIRAPNSCLKCDKTYMQKEKLDEHILRHHGDDKELLKTITNTIKYCKFCDYKTTVLKRFQLHTAKIDGSSKKRVPTYKCKMCSYKSHHELNYKTHLGVHSSEKDFCCAECRKEFAAKINLDEHILRQHNKNDQLLKTITQRLIYCSYCDYKTVKSYCFKSHVKNHLR